MLKLLIMKQSQQSNYIEWTKPLISVKEHQQQLNKIRDQLHRFEQDVWQEERKKHTLISWYRDVLKQIHDIAFSDDKKLYPKKDRKIKAMQSLFNDICLKVLYDQERYSHHHGFKGSGGYDLAQYIQSLIKKATYIFPTNPDFKKEKQDLDLSEQNPNQSVQLKNWQDQTYEDVIEKWKEIRTILIDRQHILFDLKQRISHLIDLPIYNYQSWIERRVSENIQLLLYLTNKNPVEKWLVTKFIVDLLKVQLWQKDEEFQIIKHIALSIDLKAIHHNLIQLEKKVAISFEQLLKLMETKILTSDNLTNTILESEYLISHQVRFFTNQTKFWFATVAISHLKFDDQSISYYQPLDIFSNSLSQEWIDLVATNNPQQMIDYLNQHQLLVQINYEIN